MLVDHYKCISKTSGTNVTLLMEIFLAVGMCILVLEMINAHVVLILARKTLIQELSKWGILAQCELLVYRISFSLDLFIKFVNVLIALSYCIYFRANVPGRCI